MNYQNELDKIISNLDHKPTLLLHCCCAPCSSHCITYLMDHFDITVYYYNPNTEPLEEYEKRKKELIKLCQILDIKYIDGDYENKKYRELIKGMELEPEGGIRCTECFKMRLGKTCELANQENFEYFGTTLTVSPHKNSSLINQIGLDLESNSKFLVSDFKKKEGYKKSIELSKKYDLYRQDYCGCLMSKQKNADNH